MPTFLEIFLDKNPAFAPLTVKTTFKIRSEIVIVAANNGIDSTRQSSNAISISLGKAAKLFELHLLCASTKGI